MISKRYNKEIKKRIYIINYNDLDILNFNINTHKKYGKEEMKIKYNDNEICIKVNTEMEFYEFYRYIITLLYNCNNTKKLLNLEKKDYLSCMYILMNKIKNKIFTSSGICLYKLDFPIILRIKSLIVFKDENNIFIDYNMYKYDKNFYKKIDINKILV